MSDLVKRLRQSSNLFANGSAVQTNLRAAADRIEALQAAQAWQPIETAPARTEVLVYIPTAKTRPVRTGRYGLESTGKRLWVYGGEFAFDVGKATHWMPLPQPPKEET